MAHRFLLAATCGAVLACVTGCQAGFLWGSSSNEALPNNVYQSQRRLPDQLRRVALLPVWQAPTHQKLPVEADAWLAASLAASERFEVIPIERQQLRDWYQQDDFSSSARLPHGFLQRVRNASAAQAVVFIDVLHFDMYAPQRLSLKGRLVDVHTATTLWAFDEHFDLADKAQRKAFLKHLEAQLPKGLPAPDTPRLDSPRAFLQYAATHLFHTLPGSA